MLFILDAISLLELKICTDSSHPFSLLTAYYHLRGEYPTLEVFYELIASR
jgi:hypothetical protein